MLKFLITILFLDLKNKMALLPEEEVYLKKQLNFLAMIILVKICLLHLQDLKNDKKKYSN